MTGRELIFNLLNNPDINLDQEVALATKDGAFKNMEQAMFHIQKVASKDNCVTILWFDDIRHQKESIEGGPQDKRIYEIIEEFESRKDYGAEYAQAMEDAIVVLKAMLGLDKENGK